MCHKCSVCEVVVFALFFEVCLASCFFVNALYVCIIKESQHQTPDAHAFAYREQ